MRLPINLGALKQTNMTQEEFNTIKAGDELYIAKRPDNGDNAPRVGTVFIVSSRDLGGGGYVYPTAGTKNTGGCWHYSYLERTSKKQLPIFN